jgi:hypothetical protein
MSRTWSNVQATTEIEIFWDNSERCWREECGGDPIEDEIILKIVSQHCRDCARDNKPIPQDFTVTIDWVSSGYYDEGRCFGPPEKSYPPESEDERTVESVAIVTGTPDRFTTIARLESEQAFEVFESFRSHVESEELPEPDCEPDFFED